ncbi:MAG TPA: adenylyl cyclase [Chloroflexota bacterium]|nr:adenylyl cyclase [Chloroflexota bacterium]
MPTQSLRGHAARLVVTAFFAVAQLLSPTSMTLASASPAREAPDSASNQPDFGPNAIIFDPSMSTAAIQATVDAIGAQQISNQFGPQRYALLFKPGTYGSTAAPLNFDIGYYTAVAGLGLSPNDVVINGSINVRNQCLGPNGTNCIALVNFWRSLENLTITVSNPPGCQHGEFWAVSQAAPMRRVQVNGFATLMDFCTGPSFASGGFIADSQFTGSTIVNGSQQQWLVRDSVLDGWSNGVWNQVFAGAVGAPAQCFPQTAGCTGPYTTLTTSTVTRDKPFLYVDSEGHYKIFVPAVRRGASGTSWGAGAAAGRSISIEDFFVARPSDDENAIRRALDRGQNLIFTPGVYEIHKTLNVKRADTIVLGLGFPTLVPLDGVVPMTVADVPGVDLSGLLFDAGPVSSPVLLRLGRAQHAGEGDRGDEDGGGQPPAGDDRTGANPTSLQDVFFRIGGARVGKAETSLVVNSDNVLLDDIWAWRADHGNGVGWTSNTADTGLIVNGNNVTAYGLFVEHYQKFEVIWNGNGGTVVFFQNEMPYDPPSQAAWTEAPGVPGWAALKIANRVTSFNGFGLGSYSFFNQGLDIFAAHAFEVPVALPAGSLHDLLTIFLDKVNGRGGILNVVNNTGGPSVITNPDSPVTVVSYP